MKTRRHLSHLAAALGLMIVPDFDAAAADLLTSLSTTSVARPVLIERPLRTSRNPHYFEDASGHALILCGSQTWNTLQDWVNGEKL